MKGNRWRDFGLPIAFGCVVACSRLPAELQASERLVLNVDELELTLSIVDRLLGVPSTGLAWPAGTLQLLALPTILVHGVLSGVLRASPEGLVAFVAHTYAQPWSAITCVRILVTLLSSTGFALLARAFARKTQSPGAIYGALLLFATLPLVWSYSHQAMADAVAIGLMAAAFAAAEREQEPADVLCAGACVGLAVAAKFPSAILIPLVASRLLENRAKRGRRALMAALCATLVLLLACPFVWTDPLRLAKSVVGNLARSGTPIGLGIASWSLIAHAGLLGVAYVAGLVALLKRRRYQLLAGSAFSVGALVVLIARSGSVADRYYLPALLACAIGASYGVTDEAACAWFRRSPKHRALVAGFATLALGWNAYRYAADVTAAQAAQRPRLRAAEALCRRPSGTRAFVPTELFQLVAHCASRESLDRVARAARENLAHGRSIESFASPALGADFVTVFSAALTEDEQAFAARTTAMSHGKRSGPLDIAFFAEPAEQTRLGTPTKSQAWSALARGEVDLLLDRVPPGPGSPHVPRYEVRTRGDVTLR